MKVLALSPLSYSKDKPSNFSHGLSLIMQTASPLDGRAKRLHLTFAGRQLANPNTKILMDDATGM